MSLIVAMEVYCLFFMHRPFTEMYLATGLPLIINVLFLVINFSCQIGFFVFARYFKNLFSDSNVFNQLAVANAMLLNKSFVDTSRIWFWMIEILCLGFVFIIIKNALKLKKQLHQAYPKNTLIGGSA